MLKKCEEMIRYYSSQQRDKFHTKPKYSEKLAVLISLKSYLYSQLGIFSSKRSVRLIRIDRMNFVTNLKKVGIRVIGIKKLQIR